MAHSRKRLSSLIRDTLRRYFHVEFDSLPEWQRITIVSHADLASRTKGDVVGAIDECYRSVIAGKS